MMDLPTFERQEKNHVSTWFFLCKMYPDMKILAIDPGYEKVGYAIFDKDANLPKGYRYIKSGVIKTSKSTLKENRLLHIYKELNNIFISEQPKALAIETLFYFKNQKTVFQVSQAIGVIELVAAQNNLTVFRLTPLQIKSTITGYGNADKKSIQKMIMLEFGTEHKFLEDDESDAVACGMAYCILN